MKTNHHLSNSFTNPGEWQQKLNAAQTKNQAIAGTNLFESNEKELNTYYLNYLQNGMESLMPANLVWIESLAQKCPYLDGQAVFKARTLYAMLTGARTYNDLEICNNQGIYKGGLSWYEFENAGLGKIQTTSILDIRVHPNPTTGKVYFETVQGNLGEAEVQFFDMSGRTVQAIKCATSANQLDYDLNDLPSGLYIYQLKNLNGDKFTGKVIKE